ncbi:MAG: NADH-quinone oxidoreductase subunit J [Gammaproteobacteria bacterium]|nr:NADH-quinone oxidoreductase subunit J [Gammaproteobacteria bacterium]MDH3535953.1 NADH-quinone oxidoreductase subunit J [Gammaproteobacteria bacterium]
MIETVIFYVFAVATVVSATAVVTVRNPVHAALFLVLTFFTSAVIWMSLEAEFLAIALVLVYVGAVMVLFIFVVMMLDINIARLREGFVRYLPLGLLVAAIMLGLMLSVVTSDVFVLDTGEPLPKPADYSNTKALGGVLYTDYVFAFEIAAVILLVAIIAAISLTMRKRAQTKYQNPSLQNKVRKADRLRIVKMPSEEKE